MTNSKGTLYLCATPIGNLEDMTFRAVRILKEVDVIAAEDTRNSVKLLNHFDIHTPMTSYHEFNKIDKGQYLVKRLLEGENIALITDAGMPGISDPGEELVRMCRDAGVPVTAVPGACACVTALVISGRPTRRFCFEGFLPPDKKERTEILEDCREESRTMIFYEAPHHLKKTLQELAAVLGDRKITLCRELTKRFETVMPTTIFAATDYFETNDPRGEYVLVIEGKSYEEKKQEAQKNWLEMPVEEHVALYESQGFDRKEAMKKAAKDRGVSKRDIYQSLL